MVTIIQQELKHKDYISNLYNVMITTNDKLMYQYCRGAARSMHIPSYVDTTITGDRVVNLVNVRAEKLKVFYDTLARNLDRPNMFINHKSETSDKRMVQYIIDSADMDNVDVIAF